jgi:hypothetical protein
MYDNIIIFCGLSFYLSLFYILDKLCSKKTIKEEKPTYLKYTFYEVV